MTLPRHRFGAPPDPLLALLARGGVLAIPTESSYGLAVDPRNQRAIDMVYRVKERERGKPLLVVAADRRQLESLGVDLAPFDLAGWTSRWPAPLTLVAALFEPIAASAGGDELAVRVPAHDDLRRLLAVTGPLTATSANRSGEPPILDPVELDDLLDGLDAMVVDGGVLPGGPPSTLLALRGGQAVVLRYGALVAAEFSSAAVENSAETSSI